MKQIVECVPNFSEGRDQKVLDAIADAIRAVDGVSLLDVDPGPSTNRTVFTFVGTPDSVVEGALAGAKVAYRLIDMSKHKGEHKRMGAMDVCPFIPVRGVTMDDCVRCANQLAKKLAQELQVPVYLYGYASNQEYRKEVPQIRAGEYEGLAKRITEEQWKPDYGPAKFVPSWGASIVGARKFLIAYNVNLVATKEQANRIALIIRSNRKDGKAARLDGVQAMGWYLKEQNIAQVTANILDHEVTAVHQVYEEVLKEATLLKLPVTGSEIVGLVPLQALLDAAQFYIEKESLFVLEEDQKLHLAINRLGLNSIAPFDANKRIIEYMIEESNGDKLVSQSVTQFINMVADRSTAPGGGSVGAAVGALGAGLASMVAKLAYGKKIFEQNDSVMRRLIPPLHNTVSQLLQLVDDDTNAFTEFAEASKLPEGSQEEKAYRQERIITGLRSAILVPMRLARLASSLWSVISELVEVYHLPTSSDLQVSVHCLCTAVHAAACNVFINLRMDEARSIRDEMATEIRKHLELAEHMSKQILQRIDQRFPLNF